MAFRRKNIINNRETLTSWILTKMGISNFNVELDEKGMSDLIDDSIQLFCSVAYDGYDRTFMEFNITKGVRDYTLPDTILHAIDAYRDNGFGNNFDLSIGDGKLFYMNPLFTGVGNNQRFDFLNYQMMLSNIDNMEENAIAPVMFYYNSTSRKFTLQETPTEDYKLLLDVFVYPDGMLDGETSSMWDNPMIKQLCFAEAMFRWGVGSIKFSAERFDGQSSVDKSAILSLGTELLEQAKIDLYEQFDASQEIVIKIG